MAVDWRFIGFLEGRSLVGYVPVAKNAHSGVTVASGVDLGQWTSDSLKLVSPALAVKISEYVGLKGSLAARQLMMSRPRLTITDADADELDQLARANDIELTTNEYDAASSVLFDDLPDQAQTVIMSVGFQYGSLEARCPKFWSCAIRQDWQGMYDELMDFHDSFPTRRRTEAAYIKPLLTGATSIV